MSSGPLTQALRRLLRERGLSVAAILTLAVGLGSSVAMFSVVHAVLLRPLGISAPDGVAVLWPMFHETPGEFTFKHYQNMAATATVFDRIAVMGSTNWSGTVTIPGAAKPVSVPAAPVSWAFFEVLGAKPLLGRTFRAEEDVPGAPPMLIVSHAFWKTHLGGDPGVVGRSLPVKEEGPAIPFEIVGVMPPEFFFPDNADYWTPAGARIGRIAAAQKVPTSNINDGVGVFHALGRLKPGLSIADARLQAQRLIAIADGAEQGGRSAELTSLADVVFGRARQALAVLMGAVVLVLLVACTNVAGLLVARGAARTHEMAVRAALGATTRRLAGQLMLESGLLAVAGAAFGVSVAALALDSLVSLSPAVIPRLDSTRLDLTVVLFAVGATAVTTVLLGLAPCLQLRQRALVQKLGGSSKGAVSTASGTSFRRGLVTLQVATAVVLLTATGLSVRSFARLARLDLGFDPANVLTFSIGGLGESRYPKPEQRGAVIGRAVARMQQAPNVLGAAGVLLRPFAAGRIGWDSGFLLEGQANTEAEWGRNPAVNWEQVTPTYFQTMGIRLIRGRVFTDTDIERMPRVVIVSDDMAKRVWPGQDAIGKRLVEGFSSGGPTGKPITSWQTVVGVVATARYREIDSHRLDLYLPYTQADYSIAHYVVRTTGDPHAAIPSISAALTAVDPNLIVEEPTTMEEIVSKARGPWHFNMLVFSAFGVVSTGLTAIGLFGLIAYTVASRTRELGVRLALGAETRQVVNLIVAQGAKLALAGLAIGLLAAFAASRLLSGLLFEVSPTDPATFVVVVVALGLVALAACYVPARRAASVDPAILFRDE